MLLLAFILLLYRSVNPGMQETGLRGSERLPVSIRAVSQADYSLDAQSTVHPVRGEILGQILMDIPATGPAHDRLSTMQSRLLSPVPSMTADARQPLKSILLPGTATWPALRMTFDPLALQTLGSEAVREMLALMLRARR